MHFDFDRVVDRRGTGSVKYDGAAAGDMPRDVLPLWIADMDFPSPPCVVDALVERSRHGIFGYSDSDDAYFDTLRRWFSARHGWEPEPDWLIKTPGVVTALHIAVRALTQRGDGVLILQPVYAPFAHVARSTGRELVVSELVYENGGYRVDFDDFERKLAAGNVKLFILCSPHNPVGRVWTREELTRMGNACLRHGVTVIADEIHQDFVYPGSRHHVFAGLCPAFRETSITCTAPSKTFNLAGLQISNLFIPNPRLRALFLDEYDRFGLSQPAVMGLVACRAAYEGGGAWLDALVDYLAQNLAFLRGFLRERIPQITLVEPEGTYLAWLDCRALGLPAAALDELLLHKAGLRLEAGTIFGAGGDGFQRVNLACPRSVLREAAGRLERAITGRWDKR